MTEQRDYFISYTGADTAIATGLCEAVRAGGATAHFAPSDLGLSSIPEWMETGIDGCARMICVCSTTYFADEKRWSRGERLAKMHADPDGREGLVVPVLVGPCEDAMPEWMRVYPRVDVQGLSPQEAGAALVAHLRTPEQQARQNAARALATTPADFSGVPPHNLWFSGREEALGELRRTLRSGANSSVALVAGKGGVGKSTLAAEYCHFFGGAYAGVWWVNAEQGLARGLAALGERLAEKGALDFDLAQVDPKKRPGRVVEWLGRCNPGWLLVYDNITGAADLADPDPDAARDAKLLPAGMTRVILTSRRTDGFGPMVAEQNLDVWGEEQTARFLQQRAKNDDAEGARAVARVIEGLPLAAEHAAALCAKQGVAFADYANEIEEKIKQAPKGVDTDRAVYATTRRSLEALETAGEETALELLKFAAFCAPEGIRRDLLPSLPFLADAQAVDAVCETLVSWSLARLVPLEIDIYEPLCAEAGIVKSGPALGFHRLEQTAIRAWLEERGDWRAAAEAVAGWLRAAWPQIEGQPDSLEPRSWPACARLVPHVQALATATEGDGAERLPVHAFNLALNEAGVYVAVRGDAAAAAALQARGVDVKEITYGRDHPQLAIGLSNLALSLVTLGQLDAAAAGFDRAIAIETRLFAARAPALAICFSNRGEVDWKRGRFAAAAAANLRAAAIDRRAGDARSEAIRLNNLGAVLSDWAWAVDPDQAARLRRGEGACNGAALLAMRAALGDLHGDTAHGLVNSAVRLAQAGAFAPAAALMARALATWRLLGIGGESPARRAAELAFCYEQSGQTEQLAALRADEAAFLGPIQAQLEKDHAVWKETGEPVPLGVAALEDPEHEVAYQEILSWIKAEGERVAADAEAWRDARGLPLDGSGDDEWREKAIADPSIIPPTEPWSPDDLAARWERWVETGEPLFAAAREPEPAPAPAPRGWWPFR